MTLKEDKKQTRRIARLGKMLLKENDHKKRFHARYMKLAKKIDAVFVADGMPSALEMTKKILEEKKDDR